jgi:hypothetical protein
MACRLSRLKHFFLVQFEGRWYAETPETGKITKSSIIIWACRPHYPERICPLLAQASQCAVMQDLVLTILSNFTTRASRYAPSNIYATSDVQNVSKPKTTTNQTSDCRLNQSCSQRLPLG